MHVLLINPYELGRQPFGLAEPAALLAQSGFQVECLDLSLQRLDLAALGRAALVAISLPMHTATRVALEALPRIRAGAPGAHVCAYGLYAPMNAALLRLQGVHTVLGGESEPDLLALAQAVRDGTAVASDEPRVSLAKVSFAVPDRQPLPPLSRYAQLRLADGRTRTCGFTEASRGCKHLCRHCPVVPVYHGRFRVVPVELVLADIAAQVAVGAEHISFGDPDFFNGPTHAERLVRALHSRFPDLSYDVTIKVEHLLAHAGLLPVLAQTGCLFITSAVEAVDDEVLAHLAKGHTDADFDQAVALTRQAGIALAPTFVPFTPWTTLEGYRRLLVRLVDLALMEAVPPIQLAIRLLVPAGSYLLELPELRTRLAAFDPALLGYPWEHPDPRVDALQRAVQAWVEQSASRPRAEVFGHIWALAHEALGMAVPRLPESALGQPIPHMSEPWYCCAEPTRQQLESF